MTTLPRLPTSLLWRCAAPHGRTWFFLGTGPQTRMLEAHHLVKNWRDHCTTKLEFLKTVVIKIFSLWAICTPLTQPLTYTEESKIYIDGVFAPVCSVEESRRRSLYTSTDCTQREFINYFVLLIKEQSDYRLNDETPNAHVHIFCGCPSPVDCFESFCQELIRSRKWTVKEEYYGVLCYSAMFAERGRSSNKKFFSTPFLKKALRWEKAYIN